MNGCRWMRAGSLQWAAAMAAVLGLAACDESPTTPISAGGDLTSAEAEFVVLAMGATLSGAVEAQMTEMAPAGPRSSGSSGSAGGAVLFDSSPIVTTFTFERTRRCLSAGQLIVVGSGERIADRETHTVETTIEGTRTANGCAFRRNEIVITVGGDAEFDTFRRLVEGEYSGLQTANRAGSFTYITSDGREGSCDFDIHVEMDPEAGTRHVTGTVCGREVDRTVEWRSG